MTALERAVGQWPLAWSLARTAHFTLQQRALPILEYAITRRRRAQPPDARAFFKHAYLRVFELLKKDAENIQHGIYPPAVLTPENPIVHWRRLVSILLDGVALARRRENNIHDQFPEETADVVQGLPEYYKRNFHFQTDGYMSDHSAEIYDHQVEILFAGVADPMRRLILPLMKNNLPRDGEGLRVLEIGSGTGRLTRFVRLAFPKARVTVVEPSESYLAKSRHHLRRVGNVDFVQGFGEDLPFKDEHFDVVYSCFLFHELPLKIRKQVLSEAHRVLKSTGYFGFVDSIQINDDKDLDWALVQFPKDFHEPFFTDYIKRPMETILEESGFTKVTKNFGFFSKALWAHKKAPSRAH